MRFPSPTSNVHGADDKESSSGSEGHDDDHDDVSSMKAENPSDHDDAGPNRKTSHSYPHRESNLLLQMVPYNPFGSDPLLSDRLIGSGQVADSGTTSATQEVTKSVRALLDKWTTSGSAPISSILDEEAAREINDALVGGSSLILDLADIVLSVSWPMGIEPQTFNTIGTEFRLPISIFLMVMVQNGVDIPIVSKVIICRHVRQEMIHRHHMERWTSRGLLAISSSHQVDS